MGDEVEGEGGNWVHFHLSYYASYTSYSHKHTPQNLKGNPLLFMTSLYFSLVLAASFTATLFRNLVASGPIPKLILFYYYSPELL